MNQGITDNSFPESGLYSELRTPPSWLLREPRAETRDFPYSERHLQCVWYDSRWRPAVLRTSIGEEVHIEDPGRWNMEAGPDFLDATLIIGVDRRRVHGDVEIHVRPAGWTAHEHRSNSRFSGLVAHVCYFEGTLPAGILPRGTLQISLRPDLAADTTFSFENIDVASYPHSALCDAPPCRHELRTWDLSARGALLDAAGQERLKQKTRRLSASLCHTDPEQLFYEEVMAALGYKRNKGAFRQLARDLRLEHLREDADGNVVKAYALLLGVSGLLPTKTGRKWDAATQSFVRALWDFWWKMQLKWQPRVMPSSAWDRSSLRPANHPIRRLAAAASLFVGTNSILTEILRVDMSSPEKWHKTIQALLPDTCRMDYWKHRLSLTGKRQKKEISLLGPRRIGALVSNVIIPFMATRNIVVAPLLRSIPVEEDNALVQQTGHTLFGPDHNPRLYQTGLRQQGLLQIFHDFCLNTETACTTCLLQEAMQKQGKEFREAARRQKPPRPRPRPGSTRP